MFRTIQTAVFAALLAALVLLWRSPDGTGAPQRTIANDGASLVTSPAVVPDRLPPARQEYRVGETVADLPESPELPESSAVETTHYAQFGSPWLAADDLDVRRETARRERLGIPAAPTDAGIPAQLYDLVPELLEDENSGDESDVENVVRALQVELGIEASPSTPSPQTYFEPDDDARD